MAPVGNTHRPPAILREHNIQELSAVQMMVGCITIPCLEVTPAGQDISLRPLEVQSGPMDFLATIEHYIWERPQQAVAGFRARVGH